MKARANKISFFVKKDDLNSFRLLSVSKRDMQMLRFDCDMNILQLCCFENAV